jgi:hypothetical protein
VSDNVVHLPTRNTPVDLAGALVDGVNREAARTTVRKACDVAIIAAFDLDQPVYAISQLRDAIAVINTLLLDDPEPGA